MGDISREKMRELYLPRVDELVVVEVPMMKFFMVDGEGDPAGEAYAHCLKWLFAAVYPIKRVARERMGRRFVEPPLECLWWTDDPVDFVAGRKGKLKWRMMIPGPDWATEEMLADAVTEASKQLGDPPESLRLGSFEEGRSVQFMHLGPPAEEVSKLVQLHRDYLPANDLEPNGPHHEIYLTDPHRTAAEKMKTVVRQPVRQRVRQGSENCGAIES